jgi:hypothetical protein
MLSNLIMITQAIIVVDAGFTSPLTVFTHLGLNMRIGIIRAGLKIILN